MAKTDFESVEDYFSSLPVHARSVLERVREVLLAAIPGVQQVISYQIPALQLDGRPVVYFSAWQKHFSVYPATEALMQALGPELEAHQAGKGTLQFSLSEPVPGALLTRIAQVRAQETRELIEAKRAAKLSKVSASKNGSINGKNRKKTRRAKSKAP